MALVDALAIAAGIWTLEVEDEIGCGGELRMSAAAIVGGVVVGMFEPQLRPDLDGASDPLRETQRVL
jgi:hypothetical protein